MKRKNIVLATTVIAASLMTGSVFAQGQGEIWGELANNGVGTGNFFDLCNENNCQISFKSKAGAKKLLKKLNVSTSDYEFSGDKGAYTVEVDDDSQMVSLSGFLATTTVNYGFSWLTTAGAELVFEGKGDATKFVDGGNESWNLDMYYARIPGITKAAAYQYGIYIS